MHKKNLDKLFQEKLKDFSDVPDEKVWQSIEASLDEKKKSRKVIPLWWKFGGAAAVFAIAILVINPFGGSVSKSPTVTDIENINNTPEVTTKEGTSTAKDKAIETDTKLADTDNSDEIEVNYGKSDANGTKEGENTSRKTDADFKNSIDENAVQITSSKTKNTNGSENRNTIDSNTESLITEKSNEAVLAATNDADLQKTIEDPIKNTGVQPSQEDNLNQGDLVAPRDAAIAQVEEKLKDKVIEIEDPKKKSIFDEIAFQEEENVATEEKTSKWSAGPSVAPVYFDAIGEGSPVHSSFVPNSKSGDLNLSYGLSVAYEISDRLSVRSGLHKVDYGYDTNEVEFSSSLESSDNGRLANINYAANSKNLVVVSNAPKATANSVTENFAPIAADVSASATTSQNGVMSQQFGYLEVPVELQYALVDKKLGVNLIGGLSSLFLVDNSISLTSGNLTTEMGEANNVNTINFSTNVGIGVNYKFTPKVQLNIEPVFKYQLNTFSETDGTFQPFSVGVYSGVSFKF